MNKRASLREIWRETRGLIRPVRGRYLGAAAAVIVSTLITLSGPALVRYAIDAGISKHERGPLDAAAAAFLVLALAKPFVVRAQTLLAASAGERFLGSLRTATFDKLQALPLGFFERERAGVLVSRLTSDVQSLTEFIREALIEVVGSGLQIALTVVVLVILSPKLALVSLVALPILIASSWTFHHSAGRVYHAIRDRVADTLTALQEGLAGVRVVQAFRREGRTLETYNPRSQAQVRAWRSASFVNIRLFTMIPLAQTAALIAVLLVAASMYRHGSISTGTIAAYVLYLVQLFDPIARFSEWLGEFRQGLAALGKIVGLLRTPNSIVEQDGAIELPGRGALALRGVTFGYDGDRPVVHDVTVEFAVGEHVALVGATGAGKSTLAKLLTRQYDPQHGEITFGGIDLRDATLESLHRRIVVLPQEGHLFSGTIADNIRLAQPDASAEEVVHALDRIGARERFESLPDGLQTDVQTRGLRLSAGERQLVGIARVALADPAVIVLDEATSSLDPATEAAVERALAAVAAGRTVVTIAHRLSTAERADRVVVMEQGRAVEVASHDELVEQGERYAALWASWQAGLELTA
ncbi:MAG: ABC transporter ATP-binding protein/permease [Actinomycetota bacterium]|jgi:ATP-binding cassette subfamily B protein|nr:ABC transporter ATP-binding protein/permease [Actinomycetota bacterium]